MDEHFENDEGNAFPLQSPHWQLDPGAEDSAGLAPMRLVLRPGGATIDLNRPEVLFGRHSQVDVRLPLPDISRQHCRFHFKEGHWEVIDLNSLNGIYVNGERVAQAVLSHHDTVRIGSFTFEVNLRTASPTVRVPGGEAAGNVLHDIVRTLPPPTTQEIRRAS